MAQGDKVLTTVELMTAAVESIRAWERKGQNGVVCPVCGASDLQIIDRSARPHMLWYALSCSSCGLDEAISIPLVAHSADHD